MSDASDWDMIPEDLSSDEDAGWGVSRSPSPIPAPVSYPVVHAVLYGLCPFPTPSGVCSFLCHREETHNMRVRALWTVVWTLASLHAHKLEARFATFTLPVLQEYAQWEQFPQHPRLRRVWNEEWFNALWATQQDAAWPTQHNITLTPR